MFGCWCAVVGLYANRPSQVPSQRMQIWAAVVGYIASGIVQPLLVDWIKYTIGGSAATPSWMPMLLLLCNTLGMAAAGTVPTGTSVSSPTPAATAAPAGTGGAAVVNASGSASAPTTGASAAAAGGSRARSNSNVAKPQVGGAVIRAAVVDVVSALAVLAGLMLVGSGVYVVVYSTCIAWTAVWAWYRLNRTPTPSQFVGILVTTAGLAVHAIASALTASHGPASDSMAASAILVAVLTLLGGSILHSLFLVQVEELQSPAVGWTSQRLCGAVGVIECVILSTGLAAVIAWNAATFGPQSIAVPVWVTRPVVFGLFGLVTMNFIHAACFFVMLGRVGSVASGIVKGVQTVCVFTLSAILFCKFQSTQCFTWPKGASVLLVGAGVWMFFHKPKHAAAQPEAVKSAGAVPTGPQPATTTTSRAHRRPQSE